MERGVTEEEIAILEEIRDGKTEIAVDLEDGIVQNGIIICMWFLQNDKKYIEMEYLREGNTVSFNNLKLTKEGAYFFDPEQRIKDIEDHFKRNN